MRVVNISNVWRPCTWKTIEYDENWRNDNHLIRRNKKIGEKRDVRKNKINICKFIHIISCVQQTALRILINIHERYANMPTPSECGRWAQADKIDIGVLLSNAKSMGDRKIEVIFRLNIADLLEILSSWKRAICDTFCCSNCTILWSFSFNLRMPWFMRACVGWLAVWLTSGWDDDYAWLSGDWPPFLLYCQ